MVLHYTILFQWITTVLLSVSVRRGKKDNRRRTFGAWKRRGELLEVRPIWQSSSSSSRSSLLSLTGPSDSSCSRHWLILFHVQTAHNWTMTENNKCSLVTQFLLHNNPSRCPYMRGCYGMICTVVMKRTRCGKLVFSGKCIILAQTGKGELFSSLLLLDDMINILVYVNSMQKTGRRRGLAKGSTDLTCVLYEMWCDVLLVPSNWLKCDQPSGVSGMRPLTPKGQKWVDKLITWWGIITVVFYFAEQCLRRWWSVSPEACTT